MRLLPRSSNNNYSIIFNLALGSRKCPTFWKEAKVFPNLKKDGKNLIENYLPIWNLSNFLNFFQIITYLRFYRFVCYLSDFNASTRVYKEKIYCY